MVEGDFVHLRKSSEGYRKRSWSINQSPSRLHHFDISDQAGAEAIINAGT
jgi:hypothetical protein